MIDWSSFRRAPACLLRDTGEVVDADDSAVSTPQSGIILLSRGLCRFEFIPRVALLTLKDEEDAALLHAEAHAPFAASDWIVVRLSSGFGVWWWDANRVASLVEGRTQYRSDRFVPESLGYGEVRGWRQVRSVDGYEAQYMEGGALVASSWRRGPFDAAQWLGFVNAVAAASEPAPQLPPAPISPGWPIGQPWSGSLVVRRSVWRRVERIAWMTAVAAVAVSVALLGHAARYDYEAGVYRDAIAGMKSDAAASRVENRTAQDRQLADAAASVTPLPDHLIAVADVLTVMADAGVEPSSWESDPETVSVAGAGVLRVEDIASQLVRNPRLRNVEPYRVRGETVIRAEMAPHRGALSEGAP